jgi:VWFA-related protein
MSHYARLGCFLFASCLVAAAAQAQAPSAPAQAPDGRIYLDVVVSSKSGAPVSGLQQQDFTLLDNKAPKTITSFQAVAGRDAPIEIVIVLDAVNTDARTIDYERIQIDKFLHTDNGNLAFPVAIAVFTDTGVEIVGNSFSSDGNALSAALEKNNVGLRAINRAAGYWGATERLQLSMNALGQLVTREAPRPGRKLIFWVSPGWPLLNVPGTEVETKQQEQLFATLVHMSTDLLKGRITIYSIDPLGAGENTMEAAAYRQFLKGVSKPSQMQVGNLALQVAAIHSGGLALGPDNDITGLVQKCVADSAPYYEISFEPQESDGLDEYHQLEIKVATPGLTARTREDYYAEPAPQK